MERLFSVREYLRYLLRAKTKYYIHSPFVFDFVRQVLPGKGTYYDYASIEALRKRLLRSQEKVETHELGAGSLRIKKGGSVAEVARHSAKPRKYAQLLFRIAARYHCRYRLELGTSLGLTALYLAAAVKDGALITLEGNPNLAALARHHAALLQVPGMQVITGPFDETLSAALAQLPAVDLVYFDGNHRREPTLRYFHACMERMHEGSIFIFDDIYWSREMKAAWEEIKRHPQVRVTIDLYSIGIVFFRKELSVQHFTLLY